MRDKRSILNFGFLLIVAVLTTVFVLRKTDQAVAEINALASSPAFLPDHDGRMSGL